MRKIFFVIFMLFSQILSAQEVSSRPDFDPSTDIISDNYEAGAYLIYDCDEKHWVCVREEFFKNCENVRSEQEKMLAIPERLSCAAIGEFPNKISCFQRQLFMISQAHGDKFCVSDYWKEKSIKN